jgi:hypothetical protein
MKEKDLKHRLQQTFDFSIWKEILPLFFKKIDYFSHPENVFPNDEKVIDGKQIGSVKLDDGKQLAIFTVEVADSISIVRNRQGLREIAAKHIDQNIIHGALAFFYNKNQVDYRFSFIAKEASLDLETGELIKGETKPKRYTYLLGGNEACTTPAKRMLVLADKREKGEVNIKELKEVFSVEALNKDFFKTYKAHYEKFAKHLADESNPFRAKLIDTEKETKDKEEKPIRDFVKKLLGRIVFLQFLEKKGWMGCDANTQDWTGGNPRFMYQLFEDFSKPEKFHSQCLTKLFFETLNTKRPNDIFEVMGLTGKLNGSRVPYLNGGLFEPEKNKTTLDVDFPADFFKELLEFFDQFNFTIDENSPDDHEVGIDPEMLGHIFENLLEDNRDKGIYYTPKVIVQYMCKESLIQYLLNTFQEQKAIEKFIRFYSVSPFLAEKENAVLLNQKLDDIKICDPAIGSGAFPIGMLQEIFEAKRFIYPFLKTNQDFKPAEVKKNIIQNSIYGVDLEKGAVDIAQLRFWLSLVVDELNPHPLPNLDYKIMQGNSLLEEYEGIEFGNVTLFNEPEVKVFQASMFEEPKSEYGFSIEKQANIKALIEDYFKVEDKEKKTIIHKGIDSIVIDHIDKSLEFFENKLLIEIAGLEETLKRKQELKQKAENTIKEIEKRKKQLETKSAARKRLLEFEKTDERPYFLWHLYFMDVFEQGGFDVMIGNPPYIKEYTNKAAFDGLRDSKYYQGKMDLWYGFACITLDLLKEDGLQTFIAQNNWTTSAGASNLRGKVFSENKLLAFIDFGNYKVFKSAGIQTMIYLIQKRKTRNAYQIRYSYLTNENINEKELADFLRFDIKNKFGKKYHFELKPLSDPKKSFTFNTNDDERILNLIAKNSNYKFSDKEVAQGIVPNADVVNNRNIVKIPNEIIKQYGIKTGDGVFIVKKGIFENLNENEKIYIKPIFEPKEVSRYKFVNEFDREIIYITKTNYKNDAPNLVRHLEKFRTIMDERRENQNGRLDFFHLHWPRDEYYFSGGSKILSVRKCNKPTFIYTEQPAFVMMSFNIIRTHSLNHKFLTALLNSSLIEFWLRNKGKMQGNNFQLDKEPLLNIPIKIIENTKPFETLAEYLIYLNDPKQAPVLEKVSNKAASLVFEDLVNMMVYELYFEEEMKAKEVDVLQFVTEKAFPDITNVDDKKATIQKVYYELQQKDNAIRNRILVASSRSETIARVNAATS